MNKSHPPMGFTSYDWSGLTKTGGSMPNKGMRLSGLTPILIPVSEDNGKTLDWSQTQKHGDASLTPLHLNPAIEREYLVATSSLGIRTERGYLTR